jgi:hypothetical protein
MTIAAALLAIGACDLFSQGARLEPLTVDPHEKAREETEKGADGHARDDHDRGGVHTTCFQDMR